MEKNRKYHLAIDIGASSGRHILGWKEGNSVATKEVFRFPNGMDPVDGHLVWDTERLLRSVKEGIDVALAEVGEIETFGIDTWGVDYLLLREEEPVFPCYAYRDSRTDTVVDQVHAIVPFAELYRHTGSQFQSFTTIYQLYADKLAGRLEGVTGMLMLPEYLYYRLTGVKVREYTNATTTGLINALTGDWDRGLIHTLGLPAQLFGPLTMPGAAVGSYKGIRAILCATHDTASAVEGIPMEGNVPYISSGTWSLLGVKTPKPITDPASAAANYSNEGGVGYNRYQKNIMGMWLINNLKKELAPELPFDEIVAAAEASSYAGTLDANHPSLTAPESMRAAFDGLLPTKPESVGDYFRCAYRSLAESYGAAIRELEAGTGQTYRKLYIVGGGAKNAYLNRLTAESTGKEVVALPIEASALGNLKFQFAASEEA